jgi:putative transposase
MSRACSPSTGRPYGVVLVCEEWGVARSTVYAAAARGRQAPTLPPAKRGPKTALTDEQLVEHIRWVLGESPFTGEGHRKVWARLRYQGIRTSKARVLRVDSGSTGCSPLPERAGSWGRATTTAPSSPRLRT